MPEHWQTGITGLCSSRNKTIASPHGTAIHLSILCARRRSQPLWVGAQANLGLAFRPGFISVFPGKAGF